MSNGYDSSNLLSLGGAPLSGLCLYTAPTKFHAPPQTKTWMGYGV